MASVAKRRWLHNGAEKEAWVVRYKAGGKHRSKQFERKKEADAFKRKAENEIDAGIHVPASEGVTVGDACEAFLRAQELRLHDGRISRGHLKNLRQAVDVSIGPLIGSVKLHQLTGVAVEEFYAAMVKVGGLAPATARHRVFIFGQICDFARQPGRGWLKTTPVEDARKNLRGIVAEPIRTFTSQQVLAILQAAEQRRKWAHERTRRLARCFVHLAAFCGLRYGEIAALTAARVRFEAMTIEVRHSLNEWDEIGKTKTRAGIRDVLMPSHVATMLREWIATDYVANDRGLLFRAFLSRTDQGPGGYIYPASFRNNYWWPLLKQAGLWAEDGDQFHFHALRHFASSWMIANGMPVMDTAQALGHKKFDTTLQVYAHPMIGAGGRGQIVNQMADRLFGGPVIDGTIAQEPSHSPA